MENKKKGMRERERLNKKQSKLERKVRKRDNESKE